MTPQDVNIPANGASSVACPAEAVTPAPPTVIDNCGRTLTAAQGAAPSIPTCAGTATSTFNYTDCNGTTYPWTYTYTINPPVFSNATTTTDIYTLPLHDALPIPPTVIDNCGRTLTAA